MSLYVRMSWREFLHRTDREDGYRYVLTSVCILENSLRRDTKDTNATENVSTPGNVAENSIAEILKIQCMYRVDGTEHASSYYNIRRQRKFLHRKKIRKRHK